MIDFNTIVSNLDGTPAKENDKDITLKLLVTSALSSQFQDEPNLSSDKKFKRGMLAYDIYKMTEPATLKSEDISTIKEVVGKAYSPFVVYQCYKLLDAGE